MSAGYTPLHMAVGYSHVAVAAALLDAGADPEVRWSRRRMHVLFYVWASHRSRGALWSAGKSRNLVGAFKS